MASGLRDPDARSRRHLPTAQLVGHQPPVLAECANQVRPYQYPYPLCQRMVSNGGQWRGGEAAAQIPVHYAASPALRRPYQKVTDALYAR